MGAKSDMDLIGSEQRAFDQALDELLVDHAGQFVLFKNGAAVAFYSSYEEAYDEGLKRFGTEDVFLVSEVRKRAFEPTSVSWLTGAMFVQS